MTIEIVVYNIESALKAQEGRADRIELCDNPAEGGTTPSYGTIENVRQNLNIDVFVMIRPRGGDFQYSNYEFHSMKRDIDQCQKISVDGVVLGILTPDGRIDKKRCKELIDRARPLKVTCHRAFDMTRNPFEALEDCIDVGFDRILTSGQQTQALKGIDLIAELIKKANGRIAIMPGSGVNENTVQEIVKKTSATEIHFSATKFRESEMTFRNPAIAGMGDDEGGEYKLRSVDPERIKKMRTLAEQSF
ncbi:MAG: Cytoplasmic copper homeostasis protein CutC [Cytophagales bacterium]|jgi:copper homeostasis protein|nr:copper homeostasis protein CutC [Bacteroidota bacterium]MBS1981243.1 copper homeostasis protein CutC [Bacteroidota bacterium]WHZ06505.1 MAG: Cytoplasmic copper homeostasis protein CutC [Cytophagales bacterium]